jgi:asparagine synthase (glutamine-hydrolysing)
VTEDELLEALQDSVASHLIADVPVGTFLSGGVDSSLISALMSRVSSAPVHSFSIVYDGAEDFDESIYARMVAEHLGTNHHELKVDASLIRQTERVLGFFDEPFANPAALIGAALSEFTRQYVKVALSGIGGDEFFGGYPRYLAMGCLPWLDMLPSPVSRAIGRVLDLIPTSTDRKQSTDRARRLFSAARNGRANFYDDLMSFATPAIVAGLLSPDLPASTLWRDSNRMATDGFTSNCRWAMASDVASYLPSDLLTYTDRCSMAFGLEVRTPLIDREVAAISSRLDPKQLMGGLQTKRMLKAIASRLVPPEAIYRKKKGFSVPVAQWLRGELKDLFKEALTDSRLRAAPELNAFGIGELLGRHRAGDNSVALLLWSVFVYMLWRERVTQSSWTAAPDIRDLRGGSDSLMRGSSSQRDEQIS